MRIQDAAALALEQEKSDPRITDVGGHSPSSPAGREPTTQNTEACQDGAQQSVPPEVQQAPPASGKTGATTSVTKSDREILDNLMEETREAWMTGKLDLGVPKRK